MHTFYSDNKLVVISYGKVHLWQCTVIMNKLGTQHQELTIQITYRWFSGNPIKMLSDL